MHSNSTSSSVYSRQCLLGDDSPALSLAHLLHVFTQLPVMRSKAAYPLPDQPDRAGMRERREQGQKKLSELQHSRGVEPPENPHVELLEAYGYRQLAQLMMDIPVLAIAALHAMSSSMSFRIGPPAADAAPVGDAEALAGGGNSVTVFTEKYRKDFEIWVSPSARRAADMKGMIIVIGEEHFDPAIQKIVRLVMHSFSRACGDRFLLEGEDPRNCADRVRKYQMEADDCELLEKDSAAFSALKAQAKAAEQQLIPCVEFIRKHVPAARKESIDGNLEAMSAFVGRYANEFPPSVRSEGHRLLDKAKRHLEGFHAMVLQLQPLRDRQISTLLRQQRLRGEAGRIFTIVGARHLHALRDHLQDLPCIFMLPKQLLAQHPEFSLSRGPKQEL